VADTQTKTGLTGDERDRIVMAPATSGHGLAALQIGYLLKSYNSQYKHGRIFGARTGFFTGQNKPVGVPDIAFLSYAKLPAGSLPEGHFLTIPPDLIVEVVDHEDLGWDLDHQTREWFDFGVRIVWHVYFENRRVHVWINDKSVRILDATDTITGGDILPGFESLVSAFFED
jgi:Uma2 family endonuclease